MTDYDPRIVDLYDGDNPDGPDHDFYRALADRIGARRILDLGCGTGILTVTLAGPGREVTGVDPSATMLAYACRRPGGDHVRWIEGDSRAAVADLREPVDLVVLTGNVAQHIPDPDWQRTLHDLHALLRDGGVLAFESRNPAARAWERWAGAPTTRATAHGPLREWDEVTDLGGGRVLLRSHNRFERDDETVVQDQVLTFRDLDTLTAQLNAAGFAIRATRGGWDGSPFTGTEALIVVEAAASSVAADRGVRPGRTEVLSRIAARAPRPLPPAEEVLAGERPCADRRTVLAELLAGVRAVRPDHRTLVAIDGVDGAGKTELARELAGLAGQVPGRPVIRISIDGFHHPKAARDAAGRGPEGFYRGSYRYADFRARVVDPLRAGRPVTPAIWDVVADAPVDARPLPVPERAVVLVDGIFLQRPELADVWDAAVWVDVPFEVSVPRSNSRFPGLDDHDPESPANHRYVGGQRLYLAEARPRQRATWVLDNTDLDRPRLTRNPDPGITAR